VKLSASSPNTGLNVLAGFGVNFGGSVQLAWFDNFRRIQSGQDGGSEFRISPAATVNIGYPLGQQALYLNANIGWDFHTKNPEFDSERLGFGGGLQWRLGTRCQGSVDLSYSRRQTQFDLFDDAEPSAQDRTGAALSGRCNAPGRFITSFGINAGRFKYDTPDRAFANSRSWGVNGGLGYQLGVRGSIGVFASWNESTYPNQVQFLTGEALKVEVVNIGGNASYRLGTTLTLNGSLGWTDVSSTSPFQPGFDGITWNLAAIYSGPRLGARMGLGRSVSGGDGSFSNFAVVEDFNAVISYRSGPRLSFSTGYSRTKRDNRVNPLVPPEFFGVDTTDDRLFAGASYSLIRIFSASLGINYTDRSSNRPDFDYSTTSITLGISARF
jgi:hypothetical protein